MPIVGAKQAADPKNVWREIDRLEALIREQGKQFQAGLNDAEMRLRSLEQNVADHERQIGEALGDDSLPVTVTRDY